MGCSLGNPPSHAPARPFSVTSVLEFKPLICENNGVFLPLFLDSLSDMSHFKVEEFDDFPVASFGFVTPQQKYLVRLDICLLSNNDVDFRQISLLETSTDGFVNRSVITLSPETSQAMGVREALFGDSSRLFIQAPLGNGTALQIKNVTNKGNPYTYAILVKLQPNPTHLPGESFRLRSTDPDFEKRVKFVLTQHNFTDQLSIQVDETHRYEFTDPVTLIIRNGTTEVRGPFPLNSCGHFFFCD